MKEVKKRKGGGGRRIVGRGIEGRGEGNGWEKGGRGGKKTVTLRGRTSAAKYRIGRKGRRKDRDSEHS